MSVLIKDMKMPISCIECPCSLNLFFCKVYSGMPVLDASSLTINDTTINVKRPDWCPLVELPEHHGRLIDVDAACDDFDTVNPKYQYWIDWAKRSLRAQPILIGAE